MLLLVSLSGVPVSATMAQRPGASSAGPLLLVGKHRFRGTLGTEHVTVELSIGQEGYETDAPLSC
ncbi:hypothetical protein Q5H92_04925 [Hymenobacter sp. M29]|uniref:PEGA domain-containing protein n=1 Tax=Hymenobacter mellowenesis TaxID=3063995 RepID=A0ABT9A907_9BACT|nr:hypothetical protein [Hymenobacter sp. M29]MDO7845690.1 hypothetical protein [Hymenobacter sp. M29]